MGSPVNPSPPAQTILAFDFGLLRIGVAVGNSLSQEASPLCVINASNDSKRFAPIAQLIEQWQPARLVVGRPSHPDGAEHEMTRRCQKFARQLQGRFNLPVILVDERYSSVEAQRGAKAAQNVDALAAAIILRQYWSQTHGKFDDGELARC